MAYLEITGIPLRETPDGFGLTVNIELEKGRGMSVMSDDGIVPAKLADAIEGRADFSGEIILNGMRIDPMPAKARSIRTLGTGKGIVPGRTVKENLELALKGRQLSIGEEVFLVEQELSAGYLAGFADTRAGLLDRTTATILALERILLAGCDLVMIRKLPVGESTGEAECNWNPGTELDALLEIKNILRRHRATWISLLTDPAAVHILSDKAVIFSKGNLVQDGPFRECINAPASRLVADYLSFPKMNYRNVRIERDGPFVILRSGRYGFRVSEYIKRRLSSREGEDVVVGIRPEDLGLRAYETGDPSVMNLAKVIRVDAIPGGLVANLDCEGDIWVALTEPGRSIFTGQLIELRPDPDRIHLFHPATGVSLLD